MAELDENSELAKKKMPAIRLKDILNGDVLKHPILENQLNFIFMLAFFAFVAITNHYVVEKKLEQAASLSKENQELRYEAITTASELMLLTKQSEILKRLEAAEMELEQMTTPPRTLKVN